MIDFLELVLSKIFNEWDSGSCFLKWLMKCRKKRRRHEKKGNLKKRKEKEGKKTEKKKKL
jgi:hypothetical protein